MIEDADQFRRECARTAKALMRWFESQGIGKKQALGTMALAMAAIFVDDGKNDPEVIVRNYDLTAQIIEAEMVDMQHRAMEG